MSSVFGRSAHGVKIVGRVPSGLPTAGIPNVAGSDVLPLIAAGGGLLLVISSESLGAADTFATKCGYEIDANQELIALGVAIEMAQRTGLLAQLGERRIFHTTDEAVQTLLRTSESAAGRAGEDVEVY